MKTDKKNILKTAGILVIGILFGWFLFGTGDNEVEVSHEHSEIAEGQVWTCSMHPQIRQTEPGDCPICGMDLIPLETEEIAGTGYQMSENALKLANVQTQVIGGASGEKEIRLNGKVQVDERSAFVQSSHIPGRIEKLAVNFTGEKVQRGQVLATVYSPQLVTAQEELLQASRIRESQPELFEAAKEKLRSWRIGQSQIDQIISSGKSIQNFPIRADVSGVVTEKLVDLGDYVERGSPIYQIADLSQVWVLFDLYESDLSWVNEGDKISYTVKSFPGQTFTGTITYIDPIIDPQTRVATARVEITNKDPQLKPGMFASGVVTNSLRTAGDQQLVIPKSAILWTGTRSVVYVKEPGANSFSMREVVLGPALGNSYVVKEGLNAGEEIVTNGTFTVDAAVQLSGKASMMNPVVEENKFENTIEVKVPDAAKAQLYSFVDGYLDLKNALVNDNFEAAKTGASGMMKLIKNKNLELESVEEEAWESYREEILQGLETISSAKNMESIRNGFDELSETMIGMVKTFRLTNKTLYVQFCPMANNDRGANWLSLSTEVQNPYFGSSMLNCGEVRETLR